MRRSGRALTLAGERALDVGGQAQRAHLAQRSAEGELRAADWQSPNPVARARP